MIFDREEMADREAFSRRAFLLGGAQVGLFGLLGARLYGLQIVDGERYRLLAEDNRIKIDPVAPVRGNIRDRFGVLVASSEPRLRVSVIPAKAGDLNTTLKRLGRIVPVPAEARDEILGAKRRRRHQPILVSSDLDWEAFAQLNLYGFHLPGVVTEASWVRTYPLHEAFGHVTGYVGIASKFDDTGEAVLRIPGYRIGKSGVEKIADETLRGTAGTVMVEVDAAGRPVRELERKQPSAGSELVLTIDGELQTYMHERLGEQAAAAVAMDITSGDVLGMVSTPGYDPSVFAGGITLEQWEGLMGARHRPLTNRALAGQYPPGSTFKIVTALAALDDAGIDPEETVYCPGALYYGGQRFRCWKGGGHGDVNLRDALKHSCDVYFYTVANEIGIDTLAEAGRRLGLGDSFGFPGEKPGVMPTKDWKRAEIGEPWYGGETLIAGIGQGFVLTTPLQLAVMTARIANGEYAVIPRLLRAKDAPEPEFEPLNIDPMIIDKIREGLDAVVNEKGGTATRSKLQLDGVRMAGKTGTAQVRSSRGDNRRDEDKPYAERPHALFVAYAPADAPRYAVAVIVEHGIGGARTAAPIARDILTQALWTDPATRITYDRGGPISDFTGRVARATPGQAPAPQRKPEGGA